MSENRDLRQQRYTVLTEARALKEKGAAMTPQERSKLARLVGQAQQLRERIERVEGEMMGEIRGGDPNGGGSRASQHDEYRSAFMSYLRHGRDAMPAEQRSILSEHRDMITGGSGAGIPGVSSGGFFVPVGFVDALISTLKYTGPMTDESVVGTMVTETGQILPYPAENDTNVVGERLGEGQQTIEGDVLLGQVLFGAYRYSTKAVKVSLELLEDSAFDLENFLIGEFAKRLGRILVSDFTNGLGSASSQPMGIVTATAASGSLVAAVGSSSNDGTSAGPNTIGSDDLINLEHAIDPLYRPGSSYMMNDSTFKAIAKVKDKYGRPLFEKSLEAGAPDRINGYPVRLNNYMQTLQTQTSSPPVTVNSTLFGPLKRYMVRRIRAMSVLRLVERWADYAQVGFIGYARYDGQVLAGPNATGQQFPFALLQNTF
jgi:HK97 family phage major capsid protein